MLALAQSAELSLPSSGECGVESLLSMGSSGSLAASKLQYSGKNISPSSPLIFRTPTSICAGLSEANPPYLLGSASSCEFCKDREPNGKGISLAWLRTGAVAMNAINEAGTSCRAAGRSICALVALSVRSQMEVPARLLKANRFGDGQVLSAC